MTPNILVISIDSCRWDTFTEAGCKLLDWGNFFQSYSQGTYTLPSHISMYHGIFPHSFIERPYYNRFVKPLFRILGRKHAGKIDSLFEFSEGTHNIFNGLAQSGYKVYGIGAVEWFRSAVLASVFPNFHFTGIDLEAQLKIIRGLINENGPIAVFVNVGETHDPYEFGGRIAPTLGARQRMRAQLSIGYLASEHLKQKYACEWAVERITDLLADIQETGAPYLVVVFSDHGECFGEDDCHGHGFFHKLVVEVPLGIFGINYAL